MTGPPVSKSMQYMRKLEQWYRSQGFAVCTLRFERRLVHGGHATATCTIPASRAAWFEVHGALICAVQSSKQVDRRLSSERDLETDLAYFMQAKHLIAGTLRATMLLSASL
eukprot:scaffold2879_cov269-Prasinococcus_capsulatus_cf.AAC.10